MVFPDKEPLVASGNDDKGESNNDGKDDSKADGSKKPDCCKKVLFCVKQISIFALGVAIAAATYLILLYLQYNDAIAKLPDRPGYGKFESTWNRKHVNVEDSDSNTTMIVGQAPLPKSLRGVFWLTHQESGSALASFGGPNLDGNGCSTGELTKEGYYCIRIAGDRVWSFANSGAFNYFKKKDSRYIFEFNNPENPTSARIRTFDEPQNRYWYSKFSMSLTHGRDEYNGSVVWKRFSDAYLSRLLWLGYSYYLVQVIDERGDKIEPAWGKYVEYVKEHSRSHNIWYLTSR